MGVGLLGGSGALNHLKRVVNKATSKRLYDNCVVQGWKRIIVAGAVNRIQHIRARYV